MPTMTGWKAADPGADWSVRFSLTDLRPARRYYYRAEYRPKAGGASKQSDLFSFVTAPAADVRAAVKFHLTTCQDLNGSGVYVPMKQQRPDFCISDGDNVYYDGQGHARTV